MALILPPLALYVHFPWCVRKCPYCDFNSHTMQGELPLEAYFAALRDDLDAQAEAAVGRAVDTVFFGGGTPSLMPPAQLAQFLDHVRARLALAPDAEITLEANPGTIERGRFAEYRSAGITRVSLGAQSFQPALLAALGRIHSADETRVAAQELHAAGLTNFNLDLMVALPGQDEAAALADVREALALQPMHLSHYQLTLEPGTVFGGRPPSNMPGHDHAADMQDACQPLLAEAGFERYETSAFARPGHRCRHNMNYWQFGDYIGIGAGAHGKRTDPARGRVERTQREREPRRYMSRGARGLAPSQTVRAAELPFEFMMNALRLIEGFDVALYEQRTGLAWDDVAARIGRLQARGLVEPTAAGWRPTRLGGEFLNEMLMEFVNLPREERPGLGLKTPVRPAT
jgi:oxygen-independent coproporphyrinogen-3 oxidase